MSDHNPMRGARVDFSECRRAHFYPELPMPSYCDEYFKYFQPGPISEEEHELFTPRDNTPPEETEEYQEALRIYEDHLRRTDEALTPWEYQYWRKRYYYLEEAVMETYWPYVRGKGIGFGREAVACLFAGAVLIFSWWIILAMWGPLRFRTVGKMMMAFILVSTFIRGSIDVAATSIIGMLLVVFVFFTRICQGSGYTIEYHRDRERNAVGLDEDQGGAGDADGEYAFVIRFSYWYCGNHSVLINLTKGVIGVE